MTDVLNMAMTTFLPYFTPIIFILLSVVVADRLREMILDSFALNTKKRRTS